MKTLTDFVETAKKEQQLCILGLFLYDFVCFDAASEMSQLDLQDFSKMKI